VDDRAASSSRLMRPRLVASGISAILFPVWRILSLLLVALASCGGTVSVYERAGDSDGGLGGQ